MMKLMNCILCILLLSSILASAQQVVIEGKFRSTQKELKVEDISAFQYLQPQDEKLLVKTDTGGNFSISFALKVAGYYRIGRNILYLSPGNKLKVDINHVYPNLSTFRGSGSEANTYLKDTPFPKGGSYLESGKNIFPQPNDQLKNILDLADQRSAELDKLKGVSGTFKALESARIRADVINSINSVGYYAPRKLKLSPGSAKKYLERFNKLSQPTVNAYLSTLKKAENLQLVVFRDIAQLVIENEAKQSNPDDTSILKIKDWVMADSLVKLMNGTDDKNKIAAFSSQLASIKSDDYRLAALRMKNSLLRYGNGDVAIDFSARNLEGRAVKLSDFKGKIIFIDLWASWCGPCLQEMPAFEKLRAQYAGNKEVIFISLSIDENIDAWKKNVALRKAQGIQWHIPRSGLKDYQVINIPRTIIIDQNFKISNFQAPVPSSSDHVKLLNKLLGDEKGQNKFTINGKLSHVSQGSILFLNYLNRDNKTIRDSVIIKDGTFHFEGRVEETCQANLLLSHVGFYSVKKNSDQTDIYIGKSALTIKGTDSISNATVLGDDENLANQQLKSELNPLIKAQRSLLYLLTPENRANPAFMEDVKQKNKGLVLKQRNLQRAFILKHPNLMASLSILKSYAGPVIDVQEIAPLYHGLSNAVKQSLAGIEFSKTIAILNNTTVGQQAPDFQLPDTLGKIISLSDFKGKYVLLDFWASWCAPCRAENPNVSAQYKKYKNQNFEVLGVSLDAANAKKAWLKAVKDDGLTWANVSELNGFNSLAAKLYHIQAIPQNFLIDPTGKIIARNLRGKELEDSLNKYIKK
ncbi:redoxin domain-containing protein [Pedobacter rhizosphaerae]|uniref:Peroxiredoxin n=1 Tax=Pedobacter rhizosphaerae TaxID=390241 RepID=A0A1H9R2K4_9SPHI|nr:redoxin domain-containing protein [Pedobacter rhizosphaerae]SER66942.1 Peroxiredoxin [Pedobacter rhizosphaerae]